MCAMDTLGSYSVTTHEELAAIYDRPVERVLAKEIDYINEQGRAFIAASPFFVFATGSRQGLDCSPKGDKPGFVQVEDDGRTLLIPDRPGNNRIDGLKNLVEDARVGLIFLAPGANETFRVNGRARISVDPNLKRRFAIDGKEPRTVIVVTVEQAFQHCPKALIRSNLWQAGTGGRPKDVPTLGDFTAARNPAVDGRAFDAEYAKRIPKELY
jgi:PPOX class probable FMN-dependent enzyme